MTNQCSICSDKNRKKIDAALVSEGATVRAIARQFNVGKDALARHVKNGHIAAKIAKAQAAQDIVEADSLLNKLLLHEGQINEVISTAHSARDYHLQLKAHKEAKGFLELQGRILGSFKDKVSPPVPPIYQIPDSEIERLAREILAKRK
jgi:IS30 family transposase